MKILPKHKRGLSPAMQKKVGKPATVVIKSKKAEPRTLHTHEQGAEVRKTRMRKRHAR